MDEHRYEIGLKNLKKIDGKQGEKVINSLADISPNVSKYIIEFAFGDIYADNTLSLKEREIITITNLLTQGDTEQQLVVHINGALNVGITKAEIIEIFVQCIPYVGFPKVLNAINIAKTIFNNNTRRTSN